MLLREVLIVPSKSSHYAVSTEKKYTDQKNLLDEIKLDLYVTVSIERKSRRPHFFIERRRATTILLM